jgi:hypothetical protein
MLKKYLFYSLIVIAAWSCSKESAEKPEVKPPVVTDTTTFKSVILETKYNVGKVSSNITCTVKGNEITALVPEFANNKKFAVTFNATHTGTVIKNADTTQINGTTVTDFTKPVNFTVTANGTTKTYKFTIKNFAGLPILYLTTASPVVSKDNYVTGSVVINTNTLFPQEKNNISLQIKGRGNSTWGHPKKPYRLKFDSKAAMLDMPAAKNWVLLANYSDKTLLRTALAFDLGQHMGLPFTFKGRFVDVVMNGEYIGSYYLTYQVEVHENRVNIPEMKVGDTSPEKITGGYLLEWDARYNEEPEEDWFKTKMDIPFVIKSPEDRSPAQKEYIQNYIQQTEDAIWADNFADPVNGYAKYINVDTFIDWYIVQELSKNQDAQSFSSIFFYKDRGGKLNMGPLWDFDLADGNVNYSDAEHPTGWWIKDGPWFSGLFRDPAFRTKLKTRWNALKNSDLKNVNTFIDQTAAYIDLSQKQNFTKWNILGVAVWPNPAIYYTYPGEVNQLKSWLNTRINWLDGEINKF